MPNFKEKLEQRIKAGSVRSLSLFPGFADFFSNDYLGLSKSAEGNMIHSGSTGSRLLSGNSVQAEETEKFLASFFNAEATVIFNSGYDANLGLFSSVPQRGDTILYDELIHASVRDGIRLSHAKSFSFRHNDVQDLERRIVKAEGTVFVAVESLYSMDGDLSPLKEIAAVCQRENALLIVDEAHSGGIFGTEGNGLCEELQISEQVFARTVTFGKAYGTHGAAVLGSEMLKSFLVNFARSFIYTTALPPYQYTWIRSQVEKAKADKARTQLQQRIDYFRNKLKDLISLSDARSPIQIILTPGVETAKKMAGVLQENRLAVKAIMSPTVAEGQERLRICVHAFNTEQEIDRLAELIHKLKV